jgi:hypothetical protein
MAQTDASFVTFGYWDSLKKGLLAGEKLLHDLRRMEFAHLEQNKREYEITKNISLAEVAPLKLIKLRETGSSGVIKLPEWVYDRDWPGHYMRRIKSVSVTVPVVNGPYAGVNCKLMMNGSWVRKTDSSSAVYPRVGTPSDFKEYSGTIQSIVTSTGQNDTGTFELVFRDDRYLPFEGAGADSEWSIALERATNAFDPTEVRDVVLHVRYTAREGGSSLKSASKTSMEGFPGYRLFSAKADFPDAWEMFKTGGTDANKQVLSLPLSPTLFPPLVGNRELKITAIHVFAKWSKTFASVAAVSELKVYIPKAQAAVLELGAGDYGQVITNSVTIPTAAGALLPENHADFSPWEVQVKSDNGATDEQIQAGTNWKLKPDALEDIWIVCEYRKQS